MEGQWEGEESAPRVGFGETFLVSFEMSDRGFLGVDRFTTTNGKLKKKIR